MRNVEHSNSNSSPSLPARSCGRVLVIDDHPQLLKMLSLALTSAGFQVSAADSLSAAQSCLARHWPEAVIVDLQRSESQGLHVLQRIRTRQSLDDVPVIFLGGDPNDGLRWRALQAGADYFSSKPLSLLELQERVDLLVRKGRPRLRVIARREEHRLAG